MDLVTEFEALKATSGLEIEWALTPNSCLRYIAQGTLYGSSLAVGSPTLF
jgi:hypothetical protein